MADQPVIQEVSDLRIYFFNRTSRVQGVSLLDVSIRAQGMNLLKDFQVQ